jgi:hypothetical protein
MQLLPFFCALHYCCLLLGSFRRLVLKLANHLLHDSIHYLIFHVSQIILTSQLNANITSLVLLNLYCKTPKSLITLVE